MVEQVFVAGQSGVRGLRGDFACETTQLVVEY